MCVCTCVCMYTMYALQYGYYITNIMHFTYMS